MELVIKHVSCDPVEWTTQAQYTVCGKVDGVHIDFTFRDSGNNAEYDTQTRLDIDCKDQTLAARLEDILNDWIACEGEGIFVDLKKGDTIDLSKYVFAPAPRPPKKTFFWRKPR